MKRALALGSALWVGLVPLGCMGETGGEMVEFEACAGGPETAQAGSPYQFDSSAGYHLSLTRALLHIGAVYLNRSRPVQGAQDTPCVLPGVYAAEVTSGLTFDAIAPELGAFPTRGRGTNDRALASEVWLTGARIDAQADATVILDYAGEATQESALYRFHGAVTISQNRQVASTDPATPGANPLCKSRIVTPIAVDLVPGNGGRLVVRVAPEVWFDRVDFKALNGAAGQGEELTIPDSLEGQPAAALFQGLRSVQAYRFAWENP